MTSIWLEILIGILLAFFSLFIAYKKGWANERAFFPLCLMIIAIIYIGFAIWREDSHAIGFNVVIAAAFILLSVLGFRKGLWLIVIGLIAHAGFDVFYEQSGHSPAPDWYAFLCLGFDLIFALALGWLL